MNPLTKKWKIRQKKIKFTIMFDVINRFLFRDITKQFILTIPPKIIYIQRKCRRLLIDRNQCIQAKAVCLRLVALENDAKVENTEMLESIVRQLIRKRAMDYHKRMVKYVQECRAIQRNYSRMFSKVPNRPKPYYHISVNQYIALL